METMAIVALPHGLMVDGEFVRSARLRELNGYDEQEFGKPGGPTIAAAITTELLDRVAVFGEGSSSEKYLKLARRLTIGDRVALLLHLRRLTFGDRIECIITCPACRDEMSVGLSVEGLLYRGGRGMPERDIRVGDVLLRIHPITGADVEALAAIPEGMTPSEALVRSCIISADPSLPARLSDETIAGVSAMLEEMDPQADIVLDLSCPICGHRFKTPFFIDDFILREIAARGRLLEKDVHWIALNYHWSMDEILSLPLGKRSRYIDLINRSLSGETI